MKKLLSVILSITMLLSSVVLVSADGANDGLCSLPLAPEKNAFSDIEGHWAEEQIKRIAAEGIISGYPDGTFRPDAFVTRAEFAKITALAFELGADFDMSEYNDLSADAWYYKYITRSAKYIPVYALPVGYENNMPYIDAENEFLPNVYAMRMHVAEALSEICLENTNNDFNIPAIGIIKSELEERFNDDDYENLYVMHGKVPVNVQRMFEYTYIASELKIMQGDDEGNFNPYGHVTRAELVTMIDRMIAKGCGTPLFYEYFDLFDMKLDDIKTMNIRSGSTGELVEISARETIEKVYTFLSQSSFKTDVRSGNYGGWSYDVTMLSSGGEQLFKYVVSSGTKIGGKNYLIEDDTNQFKALIKDIYNSHYEKK